MNPLELKPILLKQCAHFVTIRRDRILKTIADIESSLKEESKSTSGDKHHTGRAMLQIDRENTGNQLKEIDLIQTQLDRISISHSSELVRLGSLVYTDRAIFFISISVGSISLNNTTYLGISPKSPIGRLLLGKKKGDSFEFNNSKYTILQIE